LKTKEKEKENIFWKKHAKTERRRGRSRPRKKIKKKSLKIKKIAFSVTIGQLFIHSFPTSIKIKENIIHINQTRKIKKKAKTKIKRKKKQLL